MTVDRATTLSSPVQLVLCGAGHWGPNIIRALLDDRRVRLSAIVETDPARRQALHSRYGVPTSADLEPHLRDPAIDAVIVSTPAASHAALAAAALTHGKHVLVEKPMAVTHREAVDLCSLAAGARRILMVGHVFLFNNAFREMRRRLEAPDFGRLLYLYARRLNLGPVRADVHAGWDLASHDVSMFLAIKKTLPATVTASGQCMIRSGIPDVIFANLFFPDGTCGHIHASWLDPQKIRDVVAVGERRMIVFDDMSLQAPLRVYNHGFDRLAADDATAIVDTFGEFRVQLKQGELVVPPTATGQPLAAELDEFVSALIAGRPVESDGRFGADVVAVLEAIDRSLAEDSRAVAVAS
jgi:predicted dehydrogenase